MKRLAVAVTVLALGACATEEVTPVTPAPEPPPAAAAQPEPVQLAPAPQGEAAKPEPAAEAPAPAAVTPAPKPAPDPRVQVYLASYKTEAHAKAGFKILAKVSPILAKQEPITRSVDLGKKGKWVRLYGMAADEAERGKLCKQLGKLVDECGARNRE